MNTNPFAMRPGRRRPSDGAPPRPARRLSFLGAGALVAVGYMDPGNWATALAGGASYGYQLLGVVVVSSLTAMLLQWIAARIGVVSARDLARLCRERFSRRVSFLLWIAAEIAIIACDVAEVVGSAVALQMLLGVSLTAGVLMSAVSTFAMLALQRHGHRTLEVFVVTLILFVGMCFVVELALAQPDWHAALAGAVPDPRIVRDAGMLWLAAGILGATVMPHNLYLHSTLVKESAPSGDDGEIARVLRSVNIGTFSALSVAFLINAALLIVSAAVFHAHGHYDVTDLADAHALIAPLVGSHWAGILFAAALLACGMNATVTGTLAGQAVMEGFLNLSIPRWQRALLTRGLAIGPALVAVALFGEHGSNQLLVASQVVLSLQLPLAVVPLVRFASDAQLMRGWRVKRVPLVLAWLAAAGIIMLNGALVWQVAAGS
ncbi:Nramp family divalent metal transporter [Paraburkholderia solisilvae]|uniref:Divalent metal cation transporter MntH n=1 Tax=Paraburkholderia solisilvae TaxID=624376 RepID=A0A6J5DXW3_9BURK|nr:Nramp family divalent metal transporter [Paraburkholderia solisilvae]CAB3759039.1 Divalent metal cation transporter MntH [Paraburkholderia solisilvae]